MSKFVKRSGRALAGSLLGSVAAAAFVSPAWAADAATEAEIKTLQAQIQALTQKIDDLTKNQAATQTQAADAGAKAADAETKAAAAQANAGATQDLAAQVGTLKQTTAQEYADLQKQAASQVKTTLTNGRPTFSSPDGQFTFDLRGIFQFDSAYYSQPHESGASPPTDLSSGTNFRRARFGFDGTAFGDWSYSFLYDMGGTAGTEGSRISNAYIQYDGLAPFHFSTGAFATPAGLEDQTGTGDLIFLERAAPVDLERGVASSDGRENYLDVFANGDDYYLSASWTGRKTGDAATFDQQMALVDRGAYRVFKSPDANVVLSATSTYVFKIADATADPGGTSPVTLSIVPENYVDATKLIATTSINASSELVWGLEGGANWKNFYAQGGYFNYSIDRVAGAGLPNPNFNGWYAEATWVLTGESRRYNAATATWAQPAAANPLGLNTLGWGAWELAARYDVTNLNYNAGALGSATPTGGIRGGEQDAWTIGLNWYPNQIVRFLFDYQNEDINRIGTAAPYKQIGQTVNIFTTRAQLAF